MQLAKRSMRHGYDTFVRPVLPRRTGSYNDVTVRMVHLGDSVIPWQSTDVSDYEAAIVRGIRDHVKAGDTVVVVGGGVGVSTVAAARRVGPEGSVITYEGSREAIETIEETVYLNGVESKVSVQHAIIGEDIRLRGSSEGAPTVSPENLPDCDVLVLDCEGAERMILERAGVRPETIVVETHGIFDAPKDAIEDLLVDAGYDVVDSRIAEERMRELCIERGIYVLTARIYPIPDDEQ